MRDIAKLANVSTATVSRVINKSGYVSASNFAKVMRIIEQHNYVPNQAAKNLFANVSNYLAIFIFDMANPFFSSVVAHLNQIAFDHGYTLLIFDAGNQPQKESEYFIRCQSIRVKGIILTEGVNRSLPTNPFLRKSLVFFDRASPGKGYHAIRSDNKKGMRLAVDYLYNLNHRRIAFIGGPEKYFTAKERREGFLRALAARNLTCHPEYILPDNPFSRATGKTAFNQILSLRTVPTAVICANEQIAQGFILAAQSRGVCIPGDISIIGFDGVDCEGTYPTLTSIRQNTQEIARLLFKAIADGDDGSDRIDCFEHIVDVELTEGESCRKIELVDF
jgi:DNA-binding LacI/PurR family transcriptional regulator